MNKSINYIFLLIIGFGFSSCSEDFFSTTLDIDPPEHIPQVATHAFLNYDNQSIDMFVSETSSITDIENNDSGRDDANVQLISNESSDYSIPFTGDVFGYNYSRDDISDSATEYTLEVELPGFNKASATQQVPSLVKLTQVEFSEDGGIDNGGDERSAIDIIIDDPADEENYYEIYVLIDSDPDPSKESYYTTYADSNDPIVSRGYNFDGILLSDVSFNGTEKSLRVQIYPTSFTEAKEKISLKLKCVTKEYFQFTKTLERFDELEDNPFATPIQIFTNFDNGVGIFSVHREELYKI